MTTLKSWNIKNEWTITYLSKCLAPSSQTKINTEQCLTDYYKLKGFNAFKSAEYAQNNILNFVEFANRNILDTTQNHTSFIFTSVTKDVVMVNTDHS